MPVTSVTLPSQIDIAIIGAGPHALTLATHLLQKRKQMLTRFIVFDPSGIWMSRWNRQFAALEIPHLRSPAVHQPDPNPHMLRTFAEFRRSELSPPYDLPGTRLFQDFCQEVICRWQLQDQVYPAQVVQIKPIGYPLRSRFRLSLADGRSLIARRVVLAIGGGMPHVPDWVSRVQSPYPPEHLCHSQQVDLPGMQLSGEKVLIVGGGLTSGHLAVGAIDKGAQAIVISRRTFQEKLFDAEPGWLGPKYLNSFWAEPSWEARWQMIQQARNGGSITPALMTQLRRLHREDKVILYEQCQVEKAIWQDSHWQISREDGVEFDCDRIWLSTGTRLDITQCSLLKEVLHAYPIEIVRGLPVLDKHLRWQGCELFIMGGWAALQVGPVARNLSGARMASDRIVPALTKPGLAFSTTRSA